MKKVSATKEQFNSAPLGHPFLGICTVCDQETGEIILKRKGAGDESVSKWSIPKYLAAAPCEFCSAAFSLMKNSHVESPAGCAKIVKDEGDLFAYIPITEKDNTIKLHGGEEVTLKHGTVIQGKMDEEGILLNSVSQEGVTFYMNLMDTK